MRFFTSREGKLVAILKLDVRLDQKSIDAIKKKIGEKDDGLSTNKAIKEFLFNCLAIGMISELGEEVVK